MAEVCTVCKTIIYDQYYSKINNLSYHDDCLLCSVCKVQLLSTCYAKDGNFFCKSDYDRHCRLSCDKCKTTLYPEDMIFRENMKVYHYNCLSCSLCGANLHQGDEYVLQRENMVCKNHFDEMKGTSEEVLIDMHRARDGRRGPKRPRTILTAMQRRQFKASFEISPKPCRKVREALAKETGLSVRVVQVWFQNQRAKMKKMHRRGKGDPKQNDDEVVASEDEETDETDCTGQESIDGNYKPYLENDTSTPIDKLYLMQDSYFSHQ